MNATDISRHQERQADARAHCRRSPTGPGPLRQGHRLALHRADDSLLLAINLFPLIWTIQLSFTNYRANRPNRAAASMSGSITTQTILSDPEIWQRMQATAHFVFWTILLQTVIGFALAYLIDRKFRGHGFWTDADPDPDDAVAGGGRQFLDLPVPAADRPVQLRGLVLLRLPPSSFQMLGDVT